MNGKEIASQIKFKSDYAKWIESEQRMENWEDAVDRVMNMHRNNPRFEKAFEDVTFSVMFAEAVQAYKNKEVLASQRALQYASDPIVKKHARQYNCSATYADRNEVFQQIMWVLLCGAGVGYSVQKQDVDKISQVQPRTKGTKTYVVPDTIEGWADSIGVLMSSYFVDEQPFPEYAGYEIKFDFSLIRPKGAFISGGFKAPGPDGLKATIEKIEKLLNSIVSTGTKKLTALNVHDVICHTADAVISGGVRRSALITLFDKDDTEMIACKTGDWYVTNPQRARANNSAVLVEGQFTKEEFEQYKKYIKEFGEPGFIIVKSDRFLYNPCAEIGFYCYSPVTGKSGFSFCNLNEINGAKSTTPEAFYKQCANAAFIGTLQAAYDTFEYLGQTTEEIVRYEALLGISITGWKNNPEVLFTPEVLKRGAAIVKNTNDIAAAIIGIKPAARRCCAKPSGNASVILGCASGIHDEHDFMYFRLMQMNKQGAVVQYIKNIAPSMVEHSVWSSTGEDDVIYVPVEVPENTIVKKQTSGVDFLKYVKTAMEYWVLPGCSPERGLHPDISHNISNTVTVDDWDSVFEYIWDNQTYFSGVSFMAAIGDKAYNQAPFTSVYTPEQIFKMYGNGAMYASGLIVDGLNVFENLWDALNLYVKGNNKLVGSRTEKLLQKDWIRRVKQFAKNYLKSDLDKTIELLLDVNNSHRWMTIKREMKKLDITNLNFKPEYLEVNELTAVACFGGACELPQR